MMAAEPERAAPVRGGLHVAGSVLDNVANVARHAVRNVQRVLDGEPVPAAGSRGSGRRHRTSARSA
jgi:hypothetical protein